MKTNKTILLYFAIVAGILLTVFIGNACNEEKEDVTNDVNKNGSIESSVNVEHLSDSADVIVTRHQVWVSNGIVKDVYHRDTIPSLGTHNTVAENEDGDQKYVEVKKDYEVYITVK